MNRFSESIRDLVAAWYRADRIRVFPTTGRLLALQVGDRFVIRGESYQVIQREIEKTTSGIVLTYQLDGSQGCGVMKVRQQLDSDANGNANGNAWGNAWGQLTISRQADQRCTSVFSSDIAMLPRSAT